MSTDGGIVFYCIAGAGALAAVVFLSRLLFLRRARIDYMDFLKGVCNVLSNGNVEEALMLCEETPGPVAILTATAIRHRESPSAPLREAVENTSREELSRLERRLAFLSITCEVAPLCGLFGALLAGLRIVSAMKAQAPLILTTDLGGALTCALLCVAAGVLVAIECHIFYALLMTRIERLSLEMQTSASEILAYLTRRQNPAGNEEEEAHA